MAVKTVEMVRKIRDKRYEETKDLPVEEQIKAVKRKSEKLREELKSLHRPASSATER
jgi:hypothetical protein